MCILYYMYVIYIVSPPVGLGSLTLSLLIPETRACFAWVGLSYAL